MIRQARCFQSSLLMNLVFIFNSSVLQLVLLFLLLLLYLLDCRGRLGFRWTRIYVKLTFFCKLFLILNIGVFIKGFFVHPVSNAVFRKFPFLKFVSFCSCPIFNYICFLIHFISYIGLSPILKVIV